MYASLRFTDSFASCFSIYIPIVLHLNLPSAISHRHAYLGSFSREAVVPVEVEVPSPFGGAAPQLQLVPQTALQVPKTARHVAAKAYPETALSAGKVDAEVVSICFVFVCLFVCLSVCCLFVVQSAIAVCLRCVSCSTADA